MLTKMEKKSEHRKLYEKSLPKLHNTVANNNLLRIHKYC